MVAEAVDKGHVGLHGTSWLPCLCVEFRAIIDGVLALNRGESVHDCRSVMGEDKNSMGEAALEQIRVHLHVEVGAESSHVRHFRGCSMPWLSVFGVHFEPSSTLNIFSLQSVFKSRIQDTDI
jgi:hypothetical protein